ncbi:MAG: hypothetical protein IJW20_05990 [Clostridia bacterium]|nr:hypothetical protein [Clostridia bacterium]
MNDFDFNFKLVIVNNLMYNSKNAKPTFEKEYNEIMASEQYKNENNKIFKEILHDEMCMSLYNYLKNLVISDEDLAKIEKMYFDGGSQIYQDLAPSWDGESKIFDVTSIEGIERLVNLKKIDIYSLTTREVEEKLKTLSYEVSF